MRLLSLLRHFLQKRSEHWLIAVSPIVPKAVLIQIGLQILLADRVINPADSPLHKTPESLDCVRVGCSHDVYASGVIDALVFVAIHMIQTLVSSPVVRVDRSFWRDVFLCDAMERFLRGNYTR